MNTDQSSDQFFFVETPDPLRQTLQLTILVAEDNEKIRKAVRLCLSQAGHEVICAASGNEAVELLAKQRFDLLITDIFMPDLDGLELIRLATKAQSSLRILAISGGSIYFPADPGLSTARLFGAHAVLLKPFGQPELFEAIQRASTIKVSAARA